MAVVYCRGNDMNNINNDGYIGLEKTAKNLDIKTLTLRKWIRQNKGLPAHQIGKLWKFKKSELDEWVKSGNSAIE